MTLSGQDDPAWDTAVSWVLREREQGLDEAARAELVAWLGQSQEHRKAYEQARQVWLVTGLIPGSRTSDS